MPGRLDIESLRAISMIARVGGVSRAAEGLALSQSAVSHKVRRLEQSLDCQILARRPGGSLFTDAGNRLVAYADRILALHDEALHSLSARPLKGTVRFGITEDMSSTDLSQVLTRFRNLHPNVTVHTRVEQSLVLQNMLETGALDVAVLQLFQGDAAPDDHVMLQEGLHWVRSPEFQTSTEKTIPFLSFSEACFYRRWAFTHADEKGWPLQVVLECNSAAGVAASISAGMGVALLNARRITRDMRIIDDQFLMPPPIVHAARLRPSNNSAALALMDMLKQH